MADEKKTETKARKPAGKAEAAKAAAAPAEPGETCSVEKCNQPVRAKGFCRKHFIGWRRGDVGDHHRYKTCSKEACRKPRKYGGLCEEHAGKEAPAAAAEGGAAPA